MLTKEEIENALIDTNGDLRATADILKLTTLQAKALEVLRFPQESASYAIAL